MSLWSILVHSLLAGSCSAAFPCSTVEECQSLPLWHIPGPNPIVSPWKPNGKSAWMSHECEVAGGVQKVNVSTYTFVYHCTGEGTGYRVGISTASTPLGPWSRPPVAPNLDVTAGGWDKDDVASFNIMPDPEHEGAWLGFYEGGMPPGGEDWSMGVARAPSPLGPWSKDLHNPILNGNRTCDHKREFTGHCGGLYIGSVLHGKHTNGEYWVYMEAPINANDEGPMALWTSKNPTGPFSFKAYVLDGGETPGRWDSGRYSESRVWYYNGLFHLFATGSSVGGEHPNKINEAVGWAVSKDGIHFLENNFNAIAPWQESTPLTQAISEGHVWFEEERELIYVYHTIRWISNSKTKFSPNGRNNEDLGVEIFTPSSKFEFEMPLITPNWGLDLAPHETSSCSYDPVTYRYCAQIKTMIKSSAYRTKVLRPALLFSVKANCDGGAQQAAASIVGFAFDSKNVEVGVKMFSLRLEGECVAGQYTGTAKVEPAKIAHTEWIATAVENTGDQKLTAVTQSVTYISDGMIHDIVPFVV